MTAFQPGDKVRITAKGRKVAEDRRHELGYDCAPADRVVRLTHGSGRSHQVYVADRWWPARCWEKIS